ncbi:Mitochondrial import inner membrane translocase subunit tim50 [Hondaea fermentalgiana]|uniref:Mitochondrial import inner membrane translocase subunit TIM50 n=1 Tax=Hondaea fermentalgiana TaxID=2315210 RepID=A0A2R5GLP7_9STRA|nr:Mitochondrial import inner membrane translocase subunit tim50 [Hondaea fermentalgiana]|eukprot:GBG31800.1 Mitochondrial import inner membrane translocase subunit tim50 [Hondaea fermentalgiana]
MLTMKLAAQRLGRAALPRTRTTTASRVQQRMCSSTSTSSSTKSSKNREIAEQLAAKRRARDEALLRNDEGGVGTLGWLLGVGGILGATGFFAFHEEGNKWFMKNVYNGTPLGASVDWVSEQVKSAAKSFTDPISDELLPDFPMETLPPGMTQPITLVLDFEDTLCHLEWDSRHGWRAAKRPGADYLLHRLSMFYEIVLFTNGNSFFLEPFVYSLDSSNVMQSKLFREATVYEDGEHIKDLSHLNRDLGRVIVIDDKAKSVPKQPENCIIVKPFEDPTQEDTTLFDLVPFLEDLAVRDPADVRPELARYKGKDIGATFKQEMKERLAQREKQQSGTLAGAIRKGGFFGGGSSSSSAPSAESQQAAQAQQAQQAAQPQFEVPLAMTPIDQANNLPPPEEVKKQIEQPEEPAKPAAPTGTLWSSLGLGR